MYTVELFNSATIYRIKNFKPVPTNYAVFGSTKSLENVLKVVSCKCIFQLKNSMKYFTLVIMVYQPFYNLIQFL